MTEVWQPIRLADVALIKHGFPFKTDYCREEQTRYLLLSPGNVSIGGGFQLGKARYYDGPIPDGYVLSAGTLFVTMTDLSRDADTLGYPAVLPDSAEVEFLHNQRLGKIEITKPECIDKWFLYYLLRTSEYRDEVLASASGSTVKHTAPKRILAFTTEIPGLNEQKRIAALLRVLDDKIELNQRMNKTLEEMAQALFKSWFVDFDPVQAKAAGRKPFGMDDATAALFPSHFEDSKLGPIPKGWKTVGLDGIADFLNGLALQKYPVKDWRALPVVKIAQLRTEDTRDAEQASADIPPQYVINDGDVIFSWSGSLTVLV